ncbi:hypothetical protein [Salana multivorans]
MTLRRVESVGARVVNDVGGSCGNGLLIEDSTFRRGSTTTSQDWPAIGTGGYTARNVLVDGVSEGMRVGGNSANCGPVAIHDSYIFIDAPDTCGDWHGDGIQGYDGVEVIVRDTTIVMNERRNCTGTAAFFYPSGQGNSSVDIDGLLVAGGGYPFRNGMPGKVRNLSVVANSWGYGPVDVKCSVLTEWQAQVVTVDAAGSVTPVRQASCTGIGN